MSAPILIISSPQAASDGSYQQLVTLLSSQGKVELQMIDRIVDGGKLMSLPRLSRQDSEIGTDKLSSCVVKSFSEHTSWRGVDLRTC